MKIGGIRNGPSSSVRKSDKAGKSDKAAFGRELRDATSDSVDDAADAGGPAEAGGAGPLTGVNALLAFQEVGGAPATDDRERRRHQARRGEQILDMLDEVRVGLVTGAIPKEKLVQVARLVRDKRATGVDPQLAAVLDEIELRAEVELAKFTRR